MDNTAIFVIVYLLITVVSVLYGLCTYYLYNEYSFIKKESSGEVPKSISFMLYYALFIFFSVILTIVTLVIPRYDSAASFFVGFFYPVSLTGFLFLALALREFSKSFPGQKVVMYSKLLVIMITIVLVNSIFSSIMSGLDMEITGIIQLIMLSVSVGPIVAAPIMMAKLRSHSKGSVLASALKFLIIGFVVNSFFGTLNYAIIEYLVVEHNSVGDYSAFLQLLLLISRSMAFFGFYLVYRSIREISGFFKGFGGNKNQGESASRE